MDIASHYGKIRQLLGLALVLYALSAVFHYTQSQRFGDNQDGVRDFSRSLNQQLQIRSGSVVASANMDPWVARTLSRLAVRLPEDQLVGYRYRDNALQVKTRGPDHLVDVRDIVRYAPVRKAEDGWYHIRFE